MPDSGMLSEVQTERSCGTLNTFVNGGSVGDPPHAA